MPTSYAKNKIHIYNYVLTHRQKINEINNKWIHNNLEQHNEKRRINYRYKMDNDLDYQFKQLRRIDIF
jgi:hypothetical protein